MDENSGYNLTFCSFFAPYFIFEKVAKNGRKGKAIVLFLLIFFHLFHSSKSGKNVRKVKAIALFLLIFSHLFTF
jgi:hypothetical protein